MENAIDATVVADATGKIVFWNAAAARVWDWCASEANGRSMEGLIFAIPQQLTEVRRALAASSQWSGEIATVAKNGQDLLLHASISTSVAGEGGGAPWLITLRPILAESGGERAARLERLEAFARTIDAAAHDLNNAISPFSMSLDLLHVRLQSPADVPLLDLLETATAHAAVAIEELLNASRQVCGRDEAGLGGGEPWGTSKDGPGTERR